jgi:pyruvate dehydrogenase E2 component (dihydrolipoamide acetyltransferase)
VEPGQRVPVGAPIAVLAQEASAEPAPHDGRVRSSPAARRAAARLDVDLAAVAGTGPDAAITLDDVERAAAPPEGAHRAPPEIPSAQDRTDALRRAIASAMARSKREIPHYYLAHPVDMAGTEAFIERRNADRPVTERIVMTPLLLRAVALAAREVPEVNGHFEDGRFRPADAVHVGLAVSLRTGGVVAPAIHDVDRKGVDDLMRDVRDLVARVRAGTMRSSEIADATITLTALGERAAELVHGIIFPPQVALVGAGSVVARPWVVDGAVVTRPVMTLTLAGDHRVSDGRRGARFLVRVAELLQRPEEL